MRIKKRLKVIECKTIIHTRNINHIIDNFLEDYSWQSFYDIKRILIKEVDNLNSYKI